MRKKDGLRNFVRLILLTGELNPVISRWRSFIPAKPYLYLNKHSTYPVTHFTSSSFC
jgi:hypothetical protein